jgi:hypothetical protein
LMMIPGWVGRLIILLISLLLMIITVIDDIGVAIDKFKKDSPIAGNSYRVKAFFIASQLVKKRTWIIHIFYLVCGIKPVENSCQFFSLFGLYSCLFTRIKEVFQPFMSEGSDHKLLCNPLGYVSQCIFLIDVVSLTN